MAITKLLYPLDLSGVAASNTIDGESHVIGADRYRAFALNYGPFYCDSLILIDVNKRKRLIRGVDYECLYTIPELIKATGGQEVAGVIIVTNKKVSTDIKVTYNVVGGHYASNVYVIEKAIKDLQLDNRNSEWANIVNKPDTFQPAPHDHDFGDVYGLEYIISVLNNINNSIVNGNSTVTDNLQKLLLDAIKEVEDKLRTHEAAMNNPHQTTAEQVNAYTKEAINKFLQEIATRFSAIEPRLSSIITDVANNKIAIESTLESIGIQAQHISSNNKAIANNTKLIGDVNKRCDDIIKSIQKINLALNELKSKDFELNNKINDVTIDIGNIKRQVINISTSITELQTVSGQALEKISLLENRIGLLKTATESNADGIQTNQQNISTLSENNIQLTNTSSQHTVQLTRLTETQVTHENKIAAIIATGGITFEAQVINLPNNLVIMTYEGTMIPNDDGQYHSWKYPAELSRAISISTALADNGSVTHHDGGVRIHEFGNSSATFSYRKLGKSADPLKNQKVWITVIGIKK